MELDHVFVMVRDLELATQQAESSGLRLTHQRVHRGQGTVNRCFGFDNAFIELLSCRDSAEIASVPVARTGLDARSRWWETGACPFGLCLRADPPPIETWSYSVPFPPGMSVEMASASERTKEPLVFFFPPGATPPPPGRQALGANMTAVELTYALPDGPSNATRLLEAHPKVNLVRAPEPWLVVTLDHASTGRSVDIPAAHLTLRC